MKTALASLLVLFLCAPVVAQELPPDILADKYLKEAAGALERADAQGALEALKKVANLDIEPLRCSLGSTAGCWSSTETVCMHGAGAEHCSRSSRSVPVGTWNTTPRRWN